MIVPTSIFDWVVAHHIVFEWPVYGTLIWSVSQKWAWLKAWFQGFNKKQTDMMDATATVLKTADDARTVAVGITKELEVVSSNHLVHLQAAVDSSHNDLKTFAGAILKTHEQIATSLERQLEVANRLLDIGAEGNRIAGLLLDRSDRGDKKA
jgi:hypothetical protein